MQNLPEGLIYLLVLAVAYLANDLFKRFGPKMEPEPPQAESDEGPTAQEPVPVGLAAASIASLTPLPGPQVAVARFVGLQTEQANRHRDGSDSRPLQGIRTRRQPGIARTLSGASNTACTS
jgi:hypothetical protein